MGHRFYWPEIGRFIQQDADKDGVNWYAYVENRPTVAVDPSGEKWYNPFTWFKRDDESCDDGDDGGKGKACENDWDPVKKLAKGSAKKVAGHIGKAMGDKGALKRLLKKLDYASKACKLPQKTREAARTCYEKLREVAGPSADPADKTVACYECCMALMDAAGCGGRAHQGCQAGCSSGD